MRKRHKQTATRLGIAAHLLLLASVSGRGTAPVVQEKREASPPQASLPSPWRLGAEAARQSNFLPRYVEMVRREKEYRASPDANSYLQARGTVASYLGEIREANRLFDEAYGALRGGGAVKPLDRSPLEGYTPTDAETFLLKAADRHRVLMLNEGHHQPQTRVLTTRLLRRLYDKGFRYLALETLNTATSGAEAAKRKYPTADTGTYTNEPVFGDMARRALEIGYTLVPYEFDGEPRAGEAMMTRMNRREMEQARNLKERVFDKNPKAKLLVHAGMGHISEKPQQIEGEKEPWVFMAIRFKELTGIDPFTVDQQTMISRSVPSAESPVYRDALRRGAVGHAVVFTDAKGKPWTLPGDSLHVDAQVFLPRVVFLNGRPDWLTRDLNRAERPVPMSLRGGSGLRLVQAFFEGEPGDAVPVDQVLLRPDEDVPSLLLPQRNGGRFWLRSWDETGKMIGTAKITL